jgi:hypothetical protein
MWFTGINYYKLAVEKDHDYFYDHMETRLKFVCALVAMATDMKHFKLYNNLKNSCDFIGREP